MDYPSVPTVHPGVWLAALIAFLAVCAAADRRRDIRPLGLSWSRWDTAIAGACYALALLLRLPALGAAPRTLLGDEAAMALEAVAVLRGERRDLFGLGWQSHPVLWFFMQSWGIRLLGQNAAGARLLAALVGSLTIPAAYCWVRLDHPRRVAGLAALLLSAYHYHIHFSRLALFNIADPLFGVLILAALRIGLRTGRALAFGAAGLGLGLTLYFYPGARLFIVLVALLGGWTAARAWRGHTPSGWRPAWALVTLAGALLAASPLLNTYAREPRAFSSRLRLNSVAAPGWLAEEARTTGRAPARVLVDQVARATLAFTLYPSVDDFYDDRRPLLWGVAAALMPLGLLLGLRRACAWAYGVPLLWMGLAVLLGGALLRYPPASSRYVTLTPVVCLFVALAIDWCGQIMGEFAPRLRRAAAWATMLLLTAAICIASIDGYFRDYLPRERLGGPNTQAANALARYLAPQPAGTRVWFLGMPRMYYGGWPMIAYVAPRVEGADALTLWEMPAPEAGGVTIYAVLPDHRAELDATRARYPGGEVAALRTPAYPEPLVYVYRLGQ